MRSSSALRQQLIRSLCWLAPNHWTCSNRPEAASDVISGKLKVWVAACPRQVCKILHRCPNHSREIPPKRKYSIADNVITGVAVDYNGVGVHVKSGDSRSNGSRDIRRADFVSNDRTKGRAYRGLSHTWGASLGETPVRQLYLTGVSPKNAQTHNYHIPVILRDIQVEVGVLTTIVSKARSSLTLNFNVKSCTKFPVYMENSWKMTAACVKVTAAPKRITWVVR